MRGLLAKFPGRRSSIAVVVAWLLLAAICIPFGAKVPDITNDEYVLPGGSDTAQISRTLRERFPGGDQRPALVVYRREGGLTRADRARIVADAATLAEVPGVADPIPPFGPRALPGLVSRTQEVALTVIPIRAGKVFRVTPTIEALREHVANDLGLEAYVTGFPAVMSDYNVTVKEADVTLLLATVGLVLFLLLAVYRSPLLALIPLVVVGVAYGVVLGIVYLLNRAIDLPVDTSSTALLLVLMFGAGTDYCLLLVARYRAALARHDRAITALREAIPEAAPAMVASGLTVVAALLVMLTAIFGIYRTLGPVNAIGVAVVLLASLTLLPAILALLGRRVLWPTRAGAAPAAAPTERGEGGRWHAIGLRVRRMPVVSLVVALILLGAGATGLTLWKTELNAVEQFRSSTDASAGYDVLSSAFPPGTVNPTAVLVEHTRRAVTASDLTTVRRRIAAVEGVQSVVDTGRRSTDGRAALLSVVYEDDPFSPPALDRTQGIRDDVADVGLDLRVLVGHGSGERLDILQATKRDAKVVVPLVLLVVLLTLIVLLRAVVAPLYLLATVVLSFAATLGATLFVFRYVFGQETFNSVLPLIVFIFLVALGSDYNIFLISRVREEAARYGTPDAMLRALAATGPVITSAGLILAGTFAVLTVIPSWDLSLIGFAVAAGVLIDTFLVRSICVPAIVWLVGERSWWPSRREDARKATVVSGVFTARELLGVEGDRDRTRS